jgi:hypothetical protein
MDEAVDFRHELPAVDEPTVTLGSRLNLDADPSDRRVGPDVAVGGMLLGSDGFYPTPGKVKFD